MAEEIVTPVVPAVEPAATTVTPAPVTPKVEPAPAAATAEKPAETPAAPVKEKTLLGDDPTAEKPAVEEK